MKPQKFSYGFLAIAFYTALLCRQNIRYLFQLISDKSADASNIAASMGIVILLIGIVVFFFSEVKAWIIFAIYFSFTAIDNIVGLLYCLKGNIRGDLFFSGYTGIAYIGLYLLFLSVSLVALYFLYRYLDDHFSFEKRKWILILIIGFCLSMVYTYLIDTAWSH